MALLIKKKLTDVTGGEVVSGTYIFINCLFFELQNNQKIILVPYKDKTFAENNALSYQFKEVTKYEFENKFDNNFWKNYLQNLHAICKQHLIDNSNGYLTDNDIEIFIP